MESRSVADLKLNKVPDSDIDKKIKKDLSLCADTYMTDNATRLLYPTLKNRLNILQKYIPGNYSTKFKNPCWLDYYQIPSSPLIQTRECHFPKFNDTVQAKQILNQVKTSGTRHVMHCLPAFFIPGFPKCATTTLHRMVIKHPQVARSRCKECHFWSEFVSQSGTQLRKRIYPLWYLEVFSRAKHTIESNPQSITLDATPLYTHSWGEKFCVLPILLKRMLPEAKFIMIMRNPTKRYISHYWVNTVANLGKTHEQSNLLQYVHSKEAMEAFHNHTVDAIMQFQLCVDENSVFHCIIKADNVNSIRLQYSLYYYHIAPWLKVIPHERFLFLRTEDLVHDSSLTMSKVWHFLDVHDLSKTATMSYNVNHAVEDLKIPSQTKQLLDKFYQPYNQLLARLLADMRYLWNDYY